LSSNLSTIFSNGTAGATFCDISEYPLASAYKIILVVRPDGAGVTRVCKEVPYDYLKKGEDTTSIYYNDRNYKNPIYSFDEVGKIVVRPDGDAKIFFFAYLTDEDITGFKDKDDFPAVSEFPNDAIQLAVLKASSNLLYAKVSQAVQEEEDSELLALLQGQMSMLDKAMKEEAERLGLPFKLVGDGNDIE